MGSLLTERQTQLLQRIVEEYIATAEPVSSRAIEAQGFFDVRSATIRNEMNDLERLGYLTQLHTSGGRVPTVAAWRTYVNHLVATEDLLPAVTVQRKVDTALAGAFPDAESLNKALARTIAQLTGLLVLVGAEDRDPYTVGLRNLLEFPEFQQMERMMGLAEFFDQCDTLFGRMVREMDGRADVTIMIGTENPVPAIRQESTLVARYRLPGRQEGTLTVVGPMRMDYRRVIGLLRYVVGIMNSLK